MKSTQRSVLIVEDQPDDVASIKRFLGDLNVNRWDVAETAEQAIEMLADDHHYDLHVFDLTLPDCANLELLDRLQARGFSAWRKSIVITGVVEELEQDRAIETFGVPVLDKAQLDGRLLAWARSIIDDSGTAWLTRVVATLGASLWGTGACSFIWVPGASATQFRSMLTAAQIIPVSQDGVLVALPNEGLKAAVELRQLLSDQLPGAPSLTSLVLMDLDASHDLYRLSQDVLTAVRRPGFSGAIWPLAEMSPRAVV